MSANPPHPALAHQFDDLVTLLNDPDLQQSPSLSDLKEVASAFRDLAKTVAAAKTPAREAPAASEPAAAQPTVPFGEVADIIYTSADTDVTPPVPQSNPMPPWRPSRQEAAQEHTGTLRILIDQSGAVVSASMAAGGETMLLNDHSHCLVQPGATASGLAALEGAAVSPFISSLDFIRDDISDHGLLAAALGAIEGVSDAVIDTILDSAPPNWWRVSGDRGRYRGFLTDFSLIRGFVPWVHETHAAHLAFLGDTVRSGDVVVTHHLPHPKSTPRMFADSPLNRFFVAGDAPVGWSSRAVLEFAPWRRRTPGLRVSSASA